jgi:ABC-type antimicrobial peptide transport system permease subunit
MTQLFGIPLDTLMWVLLVITGSIMLVVMLLALSNAIFFKVGVRNIPRRRLQMVLIVFALMLSTTLLSAVLATGDVITTTVQSVAVYNWGNIDEIIEGGHGPLGAYPDSVYYRLVRRAQHNSDIAAIAAALREQDLLVADQTSRQVRSQVTALGIIPGSERGFGGMLDVTSKKRLSITSLKPDQVYLNQTTAQLLNAHLGDTLYLYAKRWPGQRYTLHVAGVVINGGLVGDNPYLLSTIQTFHTIEGNDDIINQVFISNRGGGGISGVSLSNSVTDTLNHWLPPYVHVIQVKQNGIHASQLAENIFGRIFALFALFALAIGLLLIFLIFVLLAAERRPEMGMVRAIGAQRGQLVLMFLFEGVVYDLLSSFVGLLSGVGLGALLVYLLGPILERFNFPLKLTFQPRSLVIAYCLGVIFTFCSVTVASWLVSRMTIVAAIRDLPEQERVELTLGELGIRLLATFHTLGHALLRRKWPLLRRSLLELLPDTLVGIVRALALLGFVPLLAGYWLMEIGIENTQIVPFSLGLSLIIIGGGLLLQALFSAIVRVLARSQSDAIAVGPSGAERHKEMEEGRTHGHTARTHGHTARTHGHTARTHGHTARTHGHTARTHGRPPGSPLPYLGCCLDVYGRGDPGGRLSLSILVSTETVIPRLITTCIGLALLAYWAWPFDVLAWLGLPRFQGGIETFFVAGLMMVLGTVWAVMTNAPLLMGPFLALSARLPGIFVLTKLASAYPLHRRFRTGLSVIMFSLVVFAMTVMAIITNAMQQTYVSINEQTGGYDIQATAYFRSLPHQNEIRTSLAQHGINPNVFSAIGERQTTIELVMQLSADAPRWSVYPAQIISGSFLQGYGVHLMARAKGFSSDSAVWQALQTHPNYALIDSSALPYNPNTLTSTMVYDPSSPSAAAANQPATPPGLPPRFTYQVSGVYQGEKSFPAIPIWITGLYARQAAKLTIIGVVDNSDSAHFGLYIPQSVYSAGAIDLDTSLFSTDNQAYYNAQTYYFKAAPGQDTRRLALALGSAYLDNGLETTVLEDAIWQLRGPRILLSEVLLGVVGITLLLGVAALAITGTRAVIERRQQIGMLRALGSSRRLIQAAFLLESFLVGATGSLLGVLLGLLLARNVFAVNFFEQFNTGLTFSVPWEHLGLIIAVALLASFLGALLPAWQAGRVAPAEALRYA